jgi:isopropylmalate/homocitrate/citramalate synthase
VEIASRFEVADEVVLADTIGVAVPRRVRALVRETPGCTSTTPV